MNPRIYLDHAASTPLLPEVIEVMKETAHDTFGNPSSIHREGARAKNLLEECRKKIASILHTSPGQIYFTSCGTESNNTFLRSPIESGGVTRAISSPIEHPAVLNTLSYYCTRKKVDLVMVDTDAHGSIDLNHLEQLLAESPQSCLVSLMHVHNELGTVLPIHEVSSLCAKYGALFHSDTVQSVGAFDLNVTALGLDAISGSAHKFNGPKGAGFLYLKEPAMTSPLIFGGSQERNLRGGTENITGIASMTRALELAVEERDSRIAHIINLRKHFIKGLQESRIRFQLNSPSIHCAEKIINIYFEKSDRTDWLLMNLDIEGIAASGGSACSSGTEKASHVLEHIRPASEGRSVRFSFSHLNTLEEIDTTLRILTKLLA